VGGWGLGVGGWGSGPTPQTPNPQSPIPNPHFFIGTKLMNLKSEIYKI